MRARLGAGRAGFFHTMDAFFAAIVIVTLVIFLIAFQTSRDEYVSITSEAQDITIVLSELKLSELNTTFVSQLINDSEITETNRSVLEQIGTFWAESKLELASNLTTDALAGLVDNRSSVEILFDDTAIFNQSAVYNYTGGFGTVSGSRRMISGIKQGLPVTGISSRVFVKSIRRKTTSAFLLFGGFVGQGNITQRLSLVNDSDIKSMELLLDAGSQFTLSINNQSCLGTFTPSPNNMSADRWNISSCSGAIIPGVDIDNNFSVNFLDTNLSSAYVGGGHVKIVYSTETFAEELETNSSHQNLPGINGLINLFSSAYAPGEVSSAGIYLHYFANHSVENSSLYLTLGNHTIYEDKNSTDEQSIYIDNASLGSMLDFAEISSETLPLRLGFENFTLLNVTTVGNADIVLITDVSGSMDWCLDGHDGGGSCGGCTPVTGNNPCRITLARQLDSDFVSKVLETPGNRIALVTYSNNGAINQVLTGNNATLQTAISGFSAGGSTCIGCGLRAARNELLAHSNSTRSQYIIAMTDGIVNTRTYQPDLSRITCCSTGGLGCANPSCSNALVTDPVCGDSIDSVARDWMVYDACYAHNDTNATIHSVGFGPGAAACDFARQALESIATCGNGVNYTATNVSGLQDIYQSLADQLVEFSRDSQIISVSGDLQPSILYPDSYVEFNYTGRLDPFSYGEIAITFQRDGISSCSENIDIPAQARVVDAYATSFSSEHWTDLVTLNGNRAFDLGSYSNDYAALGDPYRIQIPENYFVPGSNLLEIRTGDSPDNSTGCSLNDSLVYTGMISSSVPYTSASSSAEGCLWTVDFDDGTTDLLPTPPDYAGSKNCSFTSTNISYDPDDAVDTAMYNLLTQFDFNQNNKSDINFEDNDLVIVFSSVGEVPFMWGPSIVQVNLRR